MRVAGGIVLWLVATLIGASAAAWFSLAGLGGWIRGAPLREDSESELTVGLGVIALVVWLVLLAISVVVLRRGSAQDSRGGRIASTLLAVVRILTVGVLRVIAIAWPELPSEIPSPPWNRT